MTLFQKSVLKKHLASLDDKTVEAAWQLFSAQFLDPAKQENIRNSKEEQYQEGFLRDLFVKVFGYVLNPSPGFNLTTELKNIGNAKKADGGILLGDKVLGIIELKGMDTVDLSKVEPQAFGYKSHQKGCRYVVISNFAKLRLYIDDATAHEEFDLFQLTPERFRLLYLLLSAENLFAGLPARIRQESALVEEDITKKFYKDYSAFKSALFEDLRKRNPQPADLAYFKNMSNLNPANLNPADWQLLLFKKSQKLLDRLLFIFFGEDKGLLPPNLITKTINDWDRLRELDEYRPLYDQFKKYFGYIDEGAQRKDFSIFAYNGGLFEPDEVLDSVKISDDVLWKYTQEISAYDFESEVDVNILGHIFEHSLNEIEEITAQLEGSEFDKTQTKRKKDGVFYTPRYITQYIVENTVGRLCEEKKTGLGIDTIDFTQDYRTKRSRTTKDGKKTTLSAEGEKVLDTITAYREWLFGLTICDPACGSGAFLNQAFEFLINEHGLVDEMLAKLRGETLAKDGRYLTDVTNDILEKNLYGVDINEEAVEIARLSLWLRSAAPGRKLTNLSNHLKCGNSLIDDPEVAGDKAFDWEAAFPEVFENGGFDVVIGNPPYVRQEIISPFKPFLEKTYETYQGTADLFVYFIEKGINMLKPSGLYSIIVANKWMRANYGKPLRTWLKQKQLIEIIDFGDLPVFADATAYPCILTVSPKALIDDYNFKVAEPKNLNFGSLEQYVNEIKFLVSQNGLEENGWALIDKSKSDLLDKLKRVGIPLSEYVDGKIFYGIKTGYNEAFVIDEKTKNELIQKDAKSAEVIKPFLAERDVKRYEIDFQNNYLIKIPFGWTNKNRGNKGAWEFLNEKYSAVSNYLLNHEVKAKKRYDQGEYWWELRACDYYAEFEKPKIIYAEIATRGQYQIESENLIVDTTAYILGNASKSLLAVLNSKIWTFLVRMVSSEIRGGFLRWKRQYLAPLPIPKFSENCSEIENAVDEITFKKRQLKKCEDQFTRLLTRRFSFTKLSKKLQSWPELDYAGFTQEVNKLLQKEHKRKMTLEEDMEWEPLFEKQKAEATALQTEIDKTDREIDQLVYELYGLTEEEIAIIEN